MLASTSRKGLSIHTVTDLDELWLARALQVSGVQALSWNHNNQVVAVGGASDTIMLVQTNNGEFLSSIPFHEEEVFEGVVKALTFSSNSRYLASSTQSSINLWDLKRRHLKATLSGHRGMVTCLHRYGDNGIISGDSLGVIRIWDIKSGMSGRELMLGNGEGGVYCVNLTLSGPERIVAGYNNGVVGVWSMKTSEICQTFTLHEGGVTDVSPSPKNPRLLASCGMDGKVFLCDLETGKSATTIKVKGDVPTCLSYSVDALHVAIGTQRGSILYYSWINPAEPLYKIVDAHSPYPVTAMSFQSPKSSSAPSTPSRTKKSVSGLAKSPAQSPARRKKADQAFLRTSHEKGSLGSTLSSLSASTMAQPGLMVGAAGVIRNNTDSGRMPMPMAIEPVQESHEEGPSTRSMEEVASLPLSESTTPPQSPGRVHAAVASANKTAAIAAARQRELEASRAFLAEVEGGAHTETEKMVRDVSSNASANVSVASSAIDALERLNRGKAAPSFTASLDNANNASLNVSANMSKPEHLRQSSDEVVRESLESKHGASASESKHSQGGYQDNEPHYTRADVDSLISARMSHRLAQKEQVAKMPPDSHAQQHKGEDGVVSEVRQGISSVTSHELQESLAVLKFDIHCDIRNVLTEQARQFNMYREDMAEMVDGLQKQLQSVLEANSELRKENERLRHIY